MKLLFIVEMVAIGWFALAGRPVQAVVQHALGVDDRAMHMVAFLVVSSTALLVWAPVTVISVCWTLPPRSNWCRFMSRAGNPRLSTSWLPALELSRAFGVGLVWPRIFAGGGGGIGRSVSVAIFAPVASPTLDPL